MYDFRNNLFIICFPFQAMCYLTRTKEPAKVISGDTEKVGLLLCKIFISSVFIIVKIVKNRYNFEISMGITSQ